METVNLAFPKGNEVLLVPLNVTILHVRCCINPKSQINLIIKSSEGAGFVQLYKEFSSWTDPKAAQ